MGIRDRDYMKRPSDDDDEHGSSPESRAEEFARRVLARSRKALVICGIILGILIIVALIVSRFSGGGQTAIAAAVSRDIGIPTANRLSLFNSGLPTLSGLCTCLH